MVHEQELTVGVDLGGTSTRIGLYDKAMHLLSSQTMPTRVSAGPQACVVEMAAAVHTLLRQRSTEGRVLGIGIGSPGPMNLRTGVLGLLPNLSGWNDFPLRDALEAAAGLPVVLESDANAAALAEWKLGAGRTTGLDSMAMLTLGTGVGSGLIFAGRIWHGMFGMGGEVGHATVEPDGLLCGCGTRGCLEMYASANGLLRLAQAAACGPLSTTALRALVARPEDFTPHEVARLAGQQDDRAAQAAFDRLGSYLGVGIANLINVLDLPMIVVGGGVASAWDLFAPAMFRAVREYSVVYRLATPTQFEVMEADRTFIRPAELGAAAAPGRGGETYFERTKVSEPRLHQRRRGQEAGLMKRCMQVFLLSLLSVTAALSACAEVRLPKMLSDHAVLQRERPIHLWGVATVGAHLSARFHAQTVTAMADALGRWSLYLAPEAAGGPYMLTISGDGADKTLNDLLVGDVWFASGQSNMEMPLSGFARSTPPAVVKDADKEIAAARNPRLRLLLVEHKSSDFPLNDSTLSWTECTPETAKNFSAVAYFFGREIAAKEHVPIGLIDATWGGTPADSWISLDAFGADAQLLPALASRAVFAEQQSDLDVRIAAEKREDDAAKAAGKPAPAHPWHPYETSWLPAGLYNGMIAPFTPMTLKGFLWYQGETNSSHDRAPSYDTLFTALIGDWRAHFAQGLLPFLYVQISSFNSPGEDWALVREQQRRTLAVANTAMAVSLDVGLADNVHPPDKQTVSARLALAARAVVYGEALPYRGPSFREATTELAPDGSGAMRVWFDFSDGLTFHGRPAGGFELAGEDHQFVPAEATVQGQTVLVKAPSMPHPRYVRFGWMSVVPESLYNQAGLPASTFTSERNPVH